MRTKNELYQEALRTVAARRQIARARAEDARAEAEAAVPALRHAEEEVRVRGIRCALAGAAGKDRAAAAAALEQSLFFSIWVRTKMKCFQPAEKIRAGDVDHIEILFQHPSGDRQRCVSLAQSGVANQQQALPGRRRKIFSVAAQVTEQICHIGANTFAQFLIHYVRIVFQPHCVKIGD